MSDPIDSDWSKAGALAAHARLRDDVTYEEVVAAIAQALAEERERARAPFLALAEELVERAHRLRYEDGPTAAIAVEVGHIEAEIRRAAEESQ